MENKLPESLGHLVRRIREENNWTLATVVRQSDSKITSGYISMIETGKVTKPSPEKIKALASGLRVETDLLSRYILELPSGFSKGEEYLVSTFRQLNAQNQVNLTVIARALRDSQDTEKEIGNQSPKRSTK